MSIVYYRIVISPRKNVTKNKKGKKNTKTGMMVSEKNGRMECKTGQVKGDKQTRNYCKGSPHSLSHKNLPGLRKTDKKNEKIPGMRE